ncbi:EF-hand domain-containing protein [bacterium]|nr:EF-hand domain-containing protein [bacterium]
MKSSIQILGIIALATSLSFGEDQAPKEKKAPNPEKAFKKLDTDNNGSVSLEEYKVSPMGTRAGDKAEPKFKKLDTDGNGSVNLDEFKAGSTGGKAKGEDKPKEEKKEDAGGGKE